MCSGRTRSQEAMPLDVGLPVLWGPPTILWVAFVGGKEVPMLSQRGERGGKGDGDPVTATFPSLLASPKLGDISILPCVSKTAQVYF
jgi:hypothetical protein